MKSVFNSKCLLWLLKFDKCFFSEAIILWSWLTCVRLCRQIEVLLVILIQKLTEKTWLDNWQLCVQNGFKLRKRLARFVFEWTLKSQIMKFRAKSLITWSYRKQTNKIMIMVPYWVNKRKISLFHKCHTNLFNDE